MSTTAIAKTKKDKVKYDRHISFDDLAPSFLDEEIKLIKESNRHVGFNNKYIHIPPQYNPLYGTSRHGTTNASNVNTPVNNEDREYLSRPNHDMNQYIFNDASNYISTRNLRRDARSRSQSPFPERIRTSTSLTRSNHNYGRLPPPPGVSVMKKVKRIVDEPKEIEDVDISNMTGQIEKKITTLTKNNTQRNSGSKSGYTQSLFSNLNEVEDRVSISNGMPSNNHLHEKDEEKPRRKSFANMTNEELSALENFYSSKNRTTKANMSDFNFSQQKTIFSNPDTFSNQPSSNRAAQDALAETLAATYPSRPVVKHRAISLTVQNSKFRDYVTKIQKRVPIKDKKERRSSLRNVNCYISGRRYTWSSVDWYVENLAKDGDHLVIVTSMPDFEEKVDNLVYYEKRQRKKNESGFHSTSINKTEKNTLKNNDLPLSKGVRLEAIYKEARDATQSILEYYAGRLQNRIIKITVELVKTNSTKDAIIQTAILYKPHIQVVSTVSTNIQIKFRNGNVKLPLFMMKYFPMPSFIVPFEFIHPKKLTDESVTIKSGVTRENRLRRLDKTINETLTNPFTREHEISQGRVMESDDEDESDESVTSINGYFPISTEQQRKIKLFDQLGYVVPRTSRDILLEDTEALFDKDGKRLTPSTSRASRRSSRVQIGGDLGMYKVKSLIIDDDSRSVSTGNSDNHSNSSSPIRKTKSIGLGPTYMSSHNKNKKKVQHVPLAKVKSLEPQSFTKSARSRSSKINTKNGKLSPTSNHHHSRKGTASPSPLPSPSLSASNSRTNFNTISSRSDLDKGKKKKRSGFGAVLGKLFG